MTQSRLTKMKNDPGRREKTTETESSELRELRRDRE